MSLMQGFELIISTVNSVIRSFFALPMTFFYQESIEIVGVILGYLRSDHRSRGSNLSVVIPPTS